ncbi:MULTISPECIES: transposase family protein [Streptomyces]|uniref:transposase family protein n=1 Tax=Streptomyces TaxID=1883 RepID=UPI000A72512D|nr:MULTISPECIES: transposase family protein [Streptomyces]
MADTATWEDRRDRPGRRTAARPAPSRHGRRERHLRHHRASLAGRADRLLAAKAPRLDRALKKIARRGGEVVLIDGTLIPTQRRTGKANRPNYSGKHHRHGLHVLALTDEKGRLIWISAARPGRTHDITAARRDHLLAHLRAAGLGALADLGFLGLDDDTDNPVVVTGFKATRARKLTPGQKDANRALAAGRVPVERGFAHLKNWRILTKLRTDPARATHLFRALLVLTNIEATSDN